MPFERDRSSSDKQQVGRNGSVSSLEALEAENRQLRQRIRELEQQQLASSTEVRSQAVEERFRAVSEASPFGIFVNDVHGDCVYINPAYTQITGATFEAARGRGWLCFVHPEDRERLAQEWGAAMERFAHGQGFVFDSIRRNIRPDGTIRILHLRATALFDGQGNGTGSAGIVEDITDYRLAEETLRRSEARLSTLISHFPMGVLMEDENRQIVLANDEFCRMFEGAGIGDGFVGRDRIALARRFSTLFTDPEAFFESIHEQFGRMDAVTGQRLPLADGRVVERDAIAIRQGEVFLGQLWLYRDITDRFGKEQSQARLLTETQERADKDPLTGLWNHGAFHRTLNDMVKQYPQTHERFAVALLDVDNFKFFNDAHGHVAGDEVLRQIAQTLRRAFRPGDCIGRIGGDEFAVLLPHLTLEHAQEMVFRLKSMVAQQGYRPTNNKSEVPIHISVGIAFVPTDGTTPVELLEVADARLYTDKLESRRQTAVTATLSETLRKRVMEELPGFPMLDALVTAVDRKDRYTRRHSEDVLLYTVMIAEELGLSEEETSWLMITALIHDVGKIGVPERVLRLPDLLSKDDYEAVKQHAVLGAAIIAAIPGLEPVLPAVRHHHECWNGSGYPDGLVAEAIPFTARIIAVADAFAAMTSDRPYRKRLGAREALERLQQGAGNQWEDDIVVAFCNAYHRRFAGDKTE